MAQALIMMMMMMRTDYQQGPLTESNLNLPNYLHPPPPVSPSWTLIAMFSCMFSKRIFSL